MLFAIFGTALALAAAPPPGPTAVARGLSALTGVTAPASEPGRLYVVQQAGVIRVVVNGQVRPEPFLDLNPANKETEERFVRSVEQFLRKWS